MLRRDGDVEMAQRALSTNQLDYALPKDLIATRPARPRDAARLLVVSRRDETIEHARVRELPRFLRAGDALVFNTSAVVPARLRGRRATGGRVEGLFVEEVEPGAWVVMLESRGRLRGGERIELVDGADRGAGHQLELIEPHSQGWIARLIGPESTEAVLDRLGRTPLPPYIRKARAGNEIADALDRKWYQTVYADPQARHSVAAPTAGLHFTRRLLRRLEGCGVRRIEVTLHVGPGTFRPITASTVERHAMHAEEFVVRPEAIAALRAGGGRIVAVGSTAVRTLESLPQPLPRPESLRGPLRGRTDLLIAPPYRFKHVDAMLTNFHLPRTTLLALVAAMLGLERVKAVYEEAARQGYRFYSYGDAMLILP